MSVSEFSTTWIPLTAAILLPPEFKTYDQSLKSTNYRGYVNQHNTITSWFENFSINTEEVQRGKSRPY